MRSWAALVSVSLMAAAGPAFAADLYGPERGHGWRHRHHHSDHHHGMHHRHHHGHSVAEEAVTVVEYREPHLPRGVLYNAPPLPLAYSYGEGTRYRGVIRAKY